MATIYVDSDASGNGDGMSWADAYTSIADAVVAVSQADGLCEDEGV